ncbi:hypothetical protein EVAR_80961_1 [Eumeta japonica]|uniref:Uncharacterized protein n=1 Tax=Eumeta variegata TaxID=151549 RepID=A0A4C1WNZ3_EUMVA|nr:hypothetical protein EVAR_80961_1 [Eumeta japonica]
MSRDQKPIKLEPKDKTPPHQMSSPPLSNMMMYRNILGSPSPQHNLAAPSPPLYAHDQYANWNIPMEVMHGGNNLAVPGPSHIAGPYSPQDMSANWPQNMGHVSPNLGHVSPNMGQVSPNMGHVSPILGQMSPNMGHVSPNIIQMTNAPMVPTSSSMGQTLKLNFEYPYNKHFARQHKLITQTACSNYFLPVAATAPPSFRRRWRTVQYNAPNSTALHYQLMMQCLVAGAMMETQMPEGWPEPGESMNLTELSGLSGLLDAAAPDQLSDNLSRLNTGDLLQARNPL